MTGNVYTRFERARILGARSLQISMGAPPLVLTDNAALDPLAIAAEEFEKGLIPVTSRRMVNDRD